MLPSRGLFCYWKGDLALSGSAQGQTVVCGFLILCRKDFTA